MQQIFDNRELAIIFWLVIFFMWIIFDRKIRNSLVPLVKVITGKKILPINIILVLYVLGIIYVLIGVGAWRNTFVFDSGAWFFGTATVSYFNLIHIKRKRVIRSLIFDTFKVTILTDFILNLYVFPFYLEVIIILLLVIVGALLGFIEYNEENKKFGNYLSGCLGFVIIFYLIFSLVIIVNNIEEFLIIENLLEFVLPLLLTILFTPFLYLFGLFILYDQLKSHLKRRLKDEGLEKLVMRKIMCKFKLRRKAIYQLIDEIISLGINPGDQLIQFLESKQLYK